MDCRRLTLVLCVLALGFAAPAARAQSLPTDPGGLVNGALGGPLPADRILNGALGAAAAAPREILNGANEQLAWLGDLRKQRLDALRRAFPDRLDVDRDGQLVLRSEALAISPSPTALARAQSEGFTITRRSRLEELGVDLFVLRAPRGLSTRQAIDRLRRLDPGGTYDFNHLYDGAGDAAPTTSNVRARDKSDEGSGVRIGLIDGGVDASHPVFAGSAITQNGLAGAAIASAHGTAVASLIAGRSGAFSGAAPGAHLFVADVFGGGPIGGSAEAIAAAFSWLVGQHVPVINASLVGPANKTLETIVRLVQSRGVLIVAAVGNDGPAAPALYPASYPGVIGVTGVDARRKVLVEAARGPQVDFAAPGADMVAAAPGGAFVQVRGTSYASPIVAGLLAKEMTVAAGDAVERLARRVLDLGPRGADKTYGRGLVGDDVRPGLSLVSVNGRTQ
jgi:subtilisin family serine protease